MITSWEFFFSDLLENPVTMITTVLALAPILIGLGFLAFNPKLFLLLIKNLGRNKVRTLLTALVTIFFVILFTAVWSVIFFLDAATKERSKDFKIIVTERWQLPSQMPKTYANYLDPTSSYCIYDPAKFGITEKDFMTWSFYGGSTDPNKRSLETLVFCFVMNPDHIRTMMDDLQDLDPQLIEKMKKNRTAVLMGQEKLRTIGKRVGDRFKLYSINYKGIDLEFEIIGELPKGRYDSSSIMNEDYFNNALDQYKGTDGGPHPLSDRRLNLIWLRVRDQETFNQLGSLIESSPVFTMPQVRCETASSGVGAFLAGYSSLLQGIKLVLVPTILVIITLISSIAIGISVRERVKEIAVLKVLGFRPRQIMILILGESMLVGGVSGLLAASMTFFFVNNVIGGVPFPIAFFPSFLIPIHAFAWGLALGFTTAFLGSFMPAMTARSVKVSEVFSKVT